MTGIPMQPVYQYPPDPKAGPVPPQPGFMYPPSGPAPQYPLYPAGPPIYNPAGECTAWNPCSFLSPLLAPGPFLTLSLVDYLSQGPSMSPWKLLGISLHGTCTPWWGGVLPVFLCPTDSYPVSLVFSSSTLYATTALLPRSLKRQLWLCCPFHDAVCFFFWGGDIPILYLHLALRVGKGLPVIKPPVKPSLGPC